MEVFPDGAAVRLRSRACELFLHADGDGLGVSLSQLRVSPRTTWEVRHVERDGAAYFLLRSAADGRYLAVCSDPALPGARGLHAVQVEREVLGVGWSARLVGDGSSDVLVRHPVDGFLCPLGCAAGVGVTQRMKGRSLLPRWSLETALVAPPPPIMLASPAMEEARGGTDQHGLALSDAPRAPTRRVHGGQRKAWAPVLGVATDSRGPFWAPLVDARSRHAGYLAQNAVIGLPHVARGGDVEEKVRGLGGGGMIVVVAADEVDRLPAPGSLWQKLRRRVRPGQHRSASPRVAVFLPLRLDGDAPAAGGEQPDPEAEAPLSVQAMVTRLERLQQGMLARHTSIREIVNRLRLIEVQAHRGTYDSDIPIRRAVQVGEEEVVNFIESYNIIKKELDTLLTDLAAEGVNPAALQDVLAQSPEEIVTVSILRRLHRRQLLKEHKVN